MSNQQFYRPELMELAAAYDPYSVIVTTAELDLPGPQIVYANSAFTRMTGYSIGELLGRTPRILQGPKTDPELLKRLRTTLNAGEDFIARTINYKRDGTEFEIEWIINHLKDSSGRTTHYVAIQRDITGQERLRNNLVHFDSELRLASESLVSRMWQLEIAERRLIQRERLAAFGQISAGVVHDLGNALAPITMFVNALDCDQSLSKAAKQSIGSIRESAAHGLKLLENLRSFYMTGRQGGMDASVDLRELVERVSEIVRPRLITSSPNSREMIRLQLDVESVPLIYGNETELTQVLVNLVFNAIDAMPAGGTITIRLHLVAAAIVISVTDTGPGVPPEVIDRCFEPYVTTKASGSGLGLSVCFGIIQRHGGVIEVANAKNGGAIFTIHLPTSVVSDLPRTTNMQSPAYSLRILYIDADQECRESANQMLSALGHQITNAANGDIGLQLAHEHEYDIVLADMQMLPTSGIDIALVLHRTRPQLQVVLTSRELLSIDDIPDALKGCVQIQKPFSPMALLHVIGKMPRQLRKMWQQAP